MESMWRRLERRIVGGGGERRARDAEPAHAGFLRILAAQRHTRVPYCRDEVLGGRRGYSGLLEAPRVCPATARCTCVTDETHGRDAVDSGSSPDYYRFGRADAYANTRLPAVVVGR